MRRSRAAAVLLLYCYCAGGGGGGGAAVSQMPICVIEFSHSDTMSGCLYCLIVLSVHMIRTISRIMTFTLAFLANHPFLVMLALCDLAQKWL